MWPTKRVSDPWPMVYVLPENEVTLTLHSYGFGWYLDGHSQAVWVRKAVRREISVLWPSYSFCFRLLTSHKREN